MPSTAGGVTPAAQGHAARRRSHARKRPSRSLSVSIANPMRPRRHCTGGSHHAPNTEDLARHRKGLHRSPAMLLRLAGRRRSCEDPHDRARRGKADPASPAVPAAFAARRRGAATLPEWVLRTSEPRRRGPRRSHSSRPAVVAWPPLARRARAAGRVLPRMRRRGRDGVNTVYHVGTMRLPRVLAAGDGRPRMLRATVRVAPCAADGPLTDERSSARCGRQRRLLAAVSSLYVDMPMLGAPRWSSRGDPASKLPDLGLTGFRVLVRGRWRRTWSRGTPRCPRSRPRGRSRTA